LKVLVRFHCLENSGQYCSKIVTGANKELRLSNFWQFDSSANNVKFYQLNLVNIWFKSCAVLTSAGQ